MGFGKLWIALFCLILIVGFLFAHGKIGDLKKKTDSLEKAYQQTKAVLKDWKDKLFDQPATEAHTVPDEPSRDEPPETAVETAGEPAFSCVLRVENGKIGIFTPDGYFIRLLDVDIRTLPESDLAALKDGIIVTSRAELLERIQDFGG